MAAVTRARNLLGGSAGTSSTALARARSASSIRPAWSRYSPRRSWATAASAGSAVTSAVAAASSARPAARWRSPAALAAAAARSSSSTRSVPVTAAGSGTRSQSLSALLKWRSVSAGARTASAS